MSAPNFSESEFERLERLSELYKEDFITGGDAWGEIRDRRLYSPKYLNFKKYCESRKALDRYVYNVIKAAKIAKDLKSSGLTPESEHQIHTLLRLFPDRHHEAWRLATLKANGGMPTWRHVREVTKEMQKAREVEKQLQKVTKDVRKIEKQIQEIQKGPLSGDREVSQQIEKWFGVKWLPRRSPQPDKPFETTVGYSRKATFKKWGLLESVVEIVGRKAIDDALQSGLLSWFFQYLEPFAGPVSYQEARDRQFVNEIGSPLRAYRILDPLFSKEKNAKLRFILSDCFMSSSLYHSLKAMIPADCPHRITVDNKPHDVFINDLIERVERESKRLRLSEQKLLEVCRGLFFSDPTDLQPWDYIEDYANCAYFRNTCLLFHVNTYREKALYTQGHREVRWTERVRRLNRKYIYITESVNGSSGFALVLCSNFDMTEELEEVGFYNIELPKGQELFQRVGFNVKERQKF